MPRPFALGLVLLAFVIAACDGTAEPPRFETQGPATAAPGGSDTPGEDGPLSRFSVAAGDTLDERGAGLLFIEISTGAIEGWRLLEEGSFPGLGVLSMSDDGRLIIMRCPGEDVEVCAFDTRSGSFRPLPGFDDFTAISPDGALLAGRTPGGVAFGRTDPGDTRPAPPAHARPVESIAWAPDSSAVVLRHGPLDPDISVLELASGENRVLAPGDQYDRAIWSPDSRRVLLAHMFATEGDSYGIAAFERGGARLWSRESAKPIENPRWSPDGRFVAFQTTNNDLVAVEHVVDATAGDERVRINGALACVGEVWTADSAAVLVGGYRSDGSVLVTLDDGTATPLGAGVTPSPYDSRTGIIFDGSNFTALDFVTGERRFIARTNVSPAWDFVHEPLFAGGRIFATFPHGGHGGCGEGPGPAVVPEITVELPPFAE